MKQYLPPLLIGALALLAISACAKQEPPSTSATPSATTPAFPGIPPAPDTAPQTYAAQAELALKELGAKQTDHGLVVALASSDFASGSSKFQPANTDRIDEISTLLDKRSDLSITITGYTDSRGSASANEKLSRERAESVRDAIVDRTSIDPARITVKGMGEANPVASNDTAEGREQNRRVELTVANSEGSFPSRVIP